MNIAYFIGTLKKEDGVTRVLLTLIEEAQKRGINSIIITGHAEDVSISPVPVIEVPSVIFPFYKEYRIALPGMGGFEKKLNDFKPDLIHVHSPDTISWAALKYAKKNAVPIMATYHTDFIRYLSYYHASFLSPLIWSIFRKFYSQMAVVTAPSEVTAGDLINQGLKNVRTIPWGVDFGRFNESFRSEEWRNKILKNRVKNILLYVSRLTWEKDLRTLAETYKLLKKQRDDFAMVVAGDGPSKKELEKLMPGAIFLGHIEKDELSKVFASSDIFLFPSSTETFGNVTIEAMASGIVPVVANVGGSKSLVENGKTGFLAESKNSIDFFNKTNLLLDDNKLKGRMREAALEFSKRFSWHNVFEELLMIYKNLKK